MQTLSEFQNFVAEINVQNGRKYKQEVLTKYKSEDNITYYLQFVYDPFIITGISDKKLDKEISATTEALLGTKIPVSAKEVLEYVRSHNTGRDVDVKVVQDYMSLLPAELLPLFRAIVTKNLQLGMDAKTINSICPGLIRTFSVQLANKYFDDPSRVEGETFALTTKIDGMRCILLKENNHTTFWSRQGQQILGLVDLEREADAHMPNNFMLDGELVAALDSPDTYKETMKRARNKDAEKHGLRMKVFDCMTAIDFRNQDCDVPFFSRRWSLDREFEKYDYKHFTPLEILYQGDDTSQIVYHLNQQVAKGEEGIMINLCNAPYDFKRTWNLQKVKLMQTLDLEVIGFEEGTNSNAGTLGALLVRYKDDNIVKVGSGFDKSVRDQIWAHQSDWLGAIVEVQYFEETKNADGGLSLRFPVFKDIRTDKTTPDY